MASTDKAEADPVVAASISAVTTKQAARIAAGAAILAALLSMLSAVISGKMTADSAASATERQLAAEGARSREEFTRSQRQIAYAAFLENETRLRFTEWRLRNILVDDNPSIAEYRKQANLAEDYRAKFTRDLSNVDVIGGQPAIDAALKMQDIHWRRADWILYGDDFLEEGRNSDPVELKKVYEGVVEQEDDLLTYQSNFKYAAHQDLVN